MTNLLNMYNLNKKKIYMALQLNIGFKYATDFLDIYDLDKIKSMFDFIFWRQS